MHDRREQELRMSRVAALSVREICAILAAYFVTASGLALEPMVTGAPPQLLLASAFLALASAFAAAAALART
jgi:hypothetical protein